MRALGFLLWITWVASASAQCEHPANWRSNDLEKLKTPCVEAWRIELNKRKRPASDSTLEWCFCYDQVERRMDAQYWWTIPRAKGGNDTLQWTDLHRWFSEDGSVAFEVDHSLMSSYGRDTSETTRTWKVDQGKGNVRVREVRLTISGDPLTDPTDWMIDSLLLRNDSLSTLRKYYTAGLMNEVHLDSTLLFQPRGSLGITREMSSRNGRKYHSITRRFDGHKLIYRVDSIFDRQALDGRTGALLEDATYEYADSLLVREVHRSVNDDENTWQLSLCADIRYIYAGKELKRIEHRDAQGLRRKHPEFEYSGDPEVPTPWFHDPFLVKGGSGLPIVMSSDYGDGPTHLLRFKYTETRPSQLAQWERYARLRLIEPN